MLFVSYCKLAPNLPQHSAESWFNLEKAETLIIGKFV
jgi:hypothetical protein